MSDSHEWCRDVRRDEAIRAAEDAAAVPAIQHRDLPEIVADLRERVARVEAAVTPKSVSLSNAEGLRTERVTLEVAHRKHTAHEWAWPQMIWLDEIRGESVRVVDDAAEITRLTADRDEAIRERDAAKEECGRLRHLLKTKESECETHHPWVHPSVAPAANAGGEKQEPVAWGVLMTPGSKVWRCSSEKQAQKCVDHFGTGTVVPLYAAPQPPRGWLTAEERALIESLRATFKQDADAVRHHGLGGNVDNWERRVRLLDAVLARETPPRVKVPHFDDLEADERPVWQSACEAWIAAIRDAGVEVADE